MWHAAQVAMPLTMGAVRLEQFSAPPKASGVAIDNDMPDGFAPVSVLPPRSCSAALGWVANATRLAAPLGWRMKVILAATPTVIFVLALRAAVSVPSVAVSV